MRLFEKITKIFNSEEEREKIDTNLADALRLFANESEKDISDIYSRAITISSQLETELKKLEREFIALKGEKVEHDTYGSTAVKNHFCEKSIIILSSLSRKGTDIEHIRHFLDDVKDSMKKINETTPRQIMHIQYHFKKEMQGVINEIKQVNSSITQIENMMTTGVIKIQNDINESNKKIKYYIQEKQQTEQECVVLTQELSDLRTRKEMLEKKLNEISLDDMKKEKDELILLESNLNILKQEIISDIGPVIKLLKKVSYENQKFTSQADEYANNPYEALLNDRDFEIVRILDDFVKEARSMRMDQKLVDKSENFLKNIDSIKGMIERAKIINQKIKSKRSRIDDVWIPLENKKAGIEEFIKDTEKRMDEVAKMLEMKKEAINNIDNQITRTQKDIAAILSSYLNKDVTIH